MRKTSDHGYPQAVDNLVDIALIVGASIRLTRLVTVDDLGRWWVADPLSARLDSLGLGKYSEGFDCPFCVGFHLTFAVVASYFTARRLRRLTAWRLGASALTVNYVTAHVSSRLDWDA